MLKFSEHEKLFDAIQIINTLIFKIFLNLDLRIPQFQLENFGVFSTPPPPLMKKKCTPNVKIYIFLSFISFN